MGLAQRKFEKYIRKGNLEKLKKLDYRENIRDSINIHARNEEAFFHSCTYGRLDIMKFLVSLEPYQGQIDIHTNHEYIFRRACNNMYLNIIKYLISLEASHGNNVFDIHYANEYVFWRACACNRLDVIKYWISLEPTHGRVNVRAPINYDHIFSEACAYGNIDICRYLISLDRDIRVTRHKIFRYATFTAQRFLLRLLPDFDWTSHIRESDYRKNLDNMANCITQLYACVNHIESDILDINVVIIIAEYLVGNIIKN